MPPAVLFDLYDTIVASDWPSWTHVTAGLVGVDDDVVERAYAVTRRARNTGDYPDVEAETRAVIEAMGILDPPLDLIRSVASAQFEFQRDEIELEPEVVPVATELRARGVRTVLVSNCSHHTVETVERLGLPDLLDAIVLSFQVRAAKPDPRIYEIALASLEGVDASDAVFVDDQVPFCDGARALGIDTRLLLRPHASPPEGISPRTNGHTVIEDLWPLLG